MLDISEELFLGNIIVKIPRPQARRLIIKRPAVKAKYIEELERYIHNSNILEELVRLKKSKDDISQAKMEKILNKLDDMKSTGMKYAEKKCRKFHMGQVPYFPGLSHMAQTLIFWKAMMRKAKGAKVKNPYLRRLAKRINFLGSNRTRDYSLRDLQNNVNMARESYNSLKKQAWNNRRVFVTELIEAAEGKQKGVLRAIQKREEIIHQWRIWNMVSKNNTGGAIVAVEVTRYQSTVRYSDQEIVEREIMRCLSKPFFLTNRNSSMSSGFTSTVGFMADKPGS